MNPTTHSRRLPAAALAAALAVGTSPAAGAAYSQAPGAQAPTTHRSTAADRDAVAITVYNQNFGLVREVRTVDMGRGRIQLEFAGVPSAVQTETVRVRPLGGGTFRVLEQNYLYDLLSPQKLLEKYVGRTVTVYRWNRETEREDALAAEVLSVNGGTVLRIGDEITFNAPGRIAFPEVPRDLIAKPTLLWLLEGGAERQRIEATYLTRGLNWKADYVMVVDEDDAGGDLNGWVTLTNGSGATFENAELKLVAGDVQRVGERRFELDGILAQARSEVADATFSEQSFFEYHLYTLGRPTTLKNNEQKQVALLDATGFALRKRLVFYGAAHYYRGSVGEVVSNQKLDVFLEFKNSARNRLGMPLPAGVVRVYKEDGSGAQQFIGEDRIDHTPRDELVRIRMGDAFDVRGDRRQMDYTVISHCVSESTWRIELRNHKDSAEEIRVVEPVGGDWDILSSSHEPERLDAHTFRFHVDVAPRGTEIVEYRVRVRWC
ncbi:MAG: DUF4139 domain-containing protein [Gemmatimonadota bacterium]